MKNSVKISITELDGNGFHLFVLVTIEGKKARFLLDTGASKTVIDKHFYETVLGRKMKVIKQETTGLHSTVQESYVGKLKLLEFGNLKIKNYGTAGVELGHVNGIYTKMKKKKIQGILGSDILLQHAMVIDYGKKTISF
jgi:predicted aspartyl protease